MFDSLATLTLYLTSYLYALHHIVYFPLRLPSTFGLLVFKRTCTGSHKATPLPHSSFWELNPILLFLEVNTTAPPPPPPLPLHQSFFLPAHACASRDYVINVIHVRLYVTTGSKKTAHYEQGFKIKLLVLKGRIVLKQ